MPASNQRLRCPALIQWLPRRRSLLQFWGDRRGGFVLLFAIALPVLLLVISGGVEVAEVVKARRELQWNVDAAALNGARELGTDQSSATAVRAQAFAASLAARSTPNWNVATAAQSNATQGSITVSQTASRASFFGNILPPGGWHLSVSSTAIANLKKPLCVLSLDSGSTQSVATAISLQSQSTVTAPQCLVKSDSNINVVSGSNIIAGSVQAAGSASGSITPAPISDAPAVPDPFSSLDINVPSTCNDNGITLTNGAKSLNPGVHCGNITVTGPSVLTLNPGEHYFVKGAVSLTGPSQITGSDVVFIFSNNTGISFSGSSSISLDGRQSGPYAGFVLVTDRQYTGTLSISASNTRKLHGTIYLPQATLSVSGSNPVADLSPWTVVVAKDLNTGGSANLVINSNYSGSNVPVPSGVGGGDGQVHLSN